MLNAITTRIAGGISKELIDLAPLPLHDVRQLTSLAVGGEEVPEQLGPALLELTGGVPLVVEALGHQLADRGAPHTVAEALARCEVPPAVRAFVLERTGRLERDARVTVAALAVLGAPASESVVRTVAGLTRQRAATALGDVMRCGLIEHDERQDRYAFRYALAGRAVYEELGAPERQRLHWRAARTLDSAGASRPFAQIARHFQQAGHRRKGAQYLELAADAAAAAADHRAAAGFLQQALSTPALSRSATIRMALKLGDAALFGRAPGTGIPVLERVLADRSLPAALRGELRFWLARLRWQCGDASSLGREMSNAAAELRRRPALAARALVARAAAEPLIEGAGDDPLGWLDHARELAARQDDPPLTIFVQTGKAYVLLYREIRLDGGRSRSCPGAPPPPSRSFSLCAPAWRLPKPRRGWGISAGPRRFSRTPSESARA